MNVPSNKFPFITCYARILDRITLNPLTKFIDALDDTKTWDLGIIYNKGGYSQYIIEFDIWNNEPVVSNGFTQLLFDDARNCKVSIWENELMQSSENDIFSIPFIQIKNSTFDNKSKFNNIIENKKFTNIYGNVNSKISQVLHGIGDHTKFQIGIELPSVDLINGIVNFVTCFEYYAEGIIVNLFFKCKFSITNKLSIPKINSIGKQIKPMSGNISMPPVYLPNGDNTTIIEAYDLKQNLKDQCITTNYIYHLFLDTGIYNFIIKTKTNTRQYNNIEVNDGIKVYYTNIRNGLIARIYDDVVEYYDEQNHYDIEKYYKSNKYDLNSHDFENCDSAFNIHDHNMKQIFGYIKDEYDQPIKDVEIIITHDDDLVVYYKTNNLGQYRFCLENGIYDIRIRCKDKRLKIIRNFFFDNNKGFFTEIKKQSSDFNNELIFTCD